MKPEEKRISKSGEKHKLMNGGWYKTRKNRCAT